MRRREFIAGLGSAAAWTLNTRAQQGERVRRVGMLIGAGENDPLYKPALIALTQALADAGWTDGHNVRMDLRWAGGDLNRIRALAREFVGSQPDIILTSTTPATVAVQRETGTIPIVFADVADPVASGLVVRLDRPSGNITGFANWEATLGGKWFGLLSEIAPGLNRVAIMFNPDTAPVSAFMPSFEAAARSLKVAPIIAPVHSDVEIETAISALGREPRGGLIVPPDVFTVVHRVSLILAAARNKVPAVPIVFVTTIDPVGAGRLLAILLCQRRRFTFLRSRPGRQLASCRHLCRPHPTRRQARRSASAISDQVRACRQSKDREGARAGSADHFARARR
jgi:putative ABC transport system substrate-binding protein